MVDCVFAEKVKGGKLSSALLMKLRMCLSLRAFSFCLVV